MGITAARLEGTVRVRAGRKLGIAEFGTPDGQPIVWLHGTPGARRQVPEEARKLADARGLRIIGIATQFVPVPEDVLPVTPANAADSPTSSSRTLLALGNSGYGVVASADAIIDLIAGF